MKIKTWKAWHCRNQNPSNALSLKLTWTPHPVRIVPEATWKKVMAVVNAADELVSNSGLWSDVRWDKLSVSLAALREHERKRK